ncbi:MAG: sulfurtransferase TusA family protein [Actinobacteria bacterium]|nr:sulfurtransferase TusA family protein [Actinomycetota bacterium]MCL5887736.1 sulfurtransferase TusA family protein [Actinomycetota bacterium]
MSETIDLRGVACPLNYVKAKLAIEPLESGAEIGLLLDSGEPVANVPRSLADDGNEVVSLKQAEEGHFELRVRKGQP